MSATDTEGRPDDPMKRRDAGLRRISRTTRMVDAGAIALVGVVTIVAAGSQPGRAASASRAVPRAKPTEVQLPTPSRQTPPEQAQPNEGDPGLQQPQQAPAPTEVPAGPVSGGS